MNQYAIYCTLWFLIKNANVCILPLIPKCEVDQNDLCHAVY